MTSSTQSSRWFQAARTSIPVGKQIKVNIPKSGEHCLDQNGNRPIFKAIQINKTNADVSERCFFVEWGR